MNDQLIIEWVAERLPGEWSTGELEMVRRRSGQSAQVRVAVRERLRLEQLLCQVLSPPPFSAAQVLAACKAATVGGSAGGAAGGSTLPWSAGIVLLMVVAGALWLASNFLRTDVEPSGSSPPNASGAAGPAPGDAAVPAGAISGVEANQQPGSANQAGAGNTSGGRPRLPVDNDEDASPSDMLPVGPAPPMPKPPLIPRAMREP
ncbi:MAG: hypothetical protein HYS13_02085 [Planctomycetia bacterium]|nr:hypothetical protein [Planctomycetia bacterium]